MNEYVAKIGNNKYIINSDEFNEVKINGKTVKCEIQKITDKNYKVKLGNNIYQITTTKLTNGKRAFITGGHYFESNIRSLLEEKVNEHTGSLNKDESNKIIKSPMPGLVLKVNKKAGEKVKTGESLLVLEAMKMENNLKSLTDGIIKEIKVKTGTSVEKNETLIILE